MTKKHWKGNRVRITVDHEDRPEDADAIAIITYLDTDTLSDVLDKYPPCGRWSITIQPLYEDEAAQ